MHITTIAFISRLILIIMYLLKASILMPTGQVYDLFQDLWKEFLGFFQKVSKRDHYQKSLKTVQKVSFIKWKNPRAGQKTSPKCYKFLIIKNRDWCNYRFDTHKLIDLAGADYLTNNDDISVIFLDRCNRRRLPYSHGASDRGSGTLPYFFNFLG